MMSCGVCVSDEIIYLWRHHCVDMLRFYITSLGDKIIVGILILPVFMTLPAIRHSGDAYSVPLGGATPPPVNVSHAQSSSMETENTSLTNITATSNVTSGASPRKSRVTLEAFQVTSDLGDLGTIDKSIGFTGASPRKSRVNLEAFQVTSDLGDKATTDSSTFGFEDSPHSGRAVHASDVNTVLGWQRRFVDKRGAGHRRSPADILSSSFDNKYMTWTLSQVQQFEGFDKLVDELSDTDTSNAYARSKVMKAFRRKKPPVVPIVRPKRLALEAGTKLNKRGTAEANNNSAINVFPIPTVRGLAAKTPERPVQGAPRPLGHVPNQTAKDLENKLLSSLFVSFHNKSETVNGAEQDLPTRQSNLFNHPTRSNSPNSTPPDLYLSRSRDSVVWPSPASTLFTCMMYAYALHQVWFVYMMLATETGCVARATASRVKKFLLLDELQHNACVEHNSAPDEKVAKPNGVHTTDNGITSAVGGKQCYLELKNVTAKWDGSTSEVNTLEDISLRVGPGELMAVIGPVGSGKSSLLMSILGELQAQSGSIRMLGTVAYVSQQPWVFSGSVRQNIIFGSKYEKAKYDKVIKVSALARDLSIMPNGDATLIGDRGVSLSGGQRARISLARALYMDADIYLLDDPLSAVDSAVGRHIFEKCIVKYLKDKPRILVTHQVQFLPVADNIFIVTEGKINSQGSYAELSQSGVDFSELLKQSEEEEKEGGKHGQHGSSGNTTSVDKALAAMEKSSITASLTSLHSMVEDYEPEAVQLPEEEERARGSVGFQVYVDYFKAGSGILKFSLLILVNILAQTFYVGSDWWLSRWSNQEEEKYAALKARDQILRDNNITDVDGLINANITLPDVPYVDSHFNIYVFSGIIVAVFVFGLARALLFFRITVDASQNLHNSMFSRILRANISFFDTNPVGRILNRFSKDVGHMDDLLPVTFFDFIQCALIILGIVLVAGVVNPWVFIPTVPLAALFVLVRKYYLQTSRSIKRLEGTLRSPVFSYLSASLQGLHTIRAMRMETKFAEEFDAYQDKHTEAWFLFLATSRWLAVRLDWLCAMFVTSVSCCSVLAADTMNAGLVGLSITYTMTLMGLFQWGVRQSAEVENQMISVERVLEYSRLSTEAELESSPDKKPPPSWPSQGAIEAHGVCLQYSQAGPLVLKDLNFSIKGTEKIGIVGRTGAGKSSLITTLFRMVEPQGNIYIDDVNIQDIGLHDLRGAISIIPQDPVLFTGSLRKNLDPFQEYSDEQLWNSLEEVKLKEAIKEIPEGLLVEVSEGGTNFSAGQRQLVCLARAVLGHTRILLIDEATANVDPITDELIQQTIRTKFKECTVLTIAHRLHTIIDSDRVMVLDAGSVVELDTPAALLAKEDGGYFYTMVEQLGKAELEHLMELANQGKQSDTIPLTTSVASTVKSDETLQDVTQIKEEHASQGDEQEGDNTYNIEDIEESLGLVSKDDEEVEEEDTEEGGEDRRHLLSSSSSPSQPSSVRTETLKDPKQRAGPNAAGDDGDEEKHGEDEESQVLIKTESKKSLKDGDSSDIQV